MCASKYLPYNRSSTAHFTLQLKDAIQQGFCCWGATGDVDVDGDDAVTAAHHGIGIVVIAAAVRTAAH